MRVESGTIHNDARWTITRWLGGAVPCLLCAWRRSVRMFAQWFPSSFEPSSGISLLHRPKTTSRPGSAHEVRNQVGLLINWLFAPVPGTAGGDGWSELPFASSSDTEHLPVAGFCSAIRTRLRCETGKAMRSARIHQNQALSPPESPSEALFLIEPSAKLGIPET